MDRRRLIALCRVGFAALVLVAIGAQFFDLAQKGVLDSVNFFSYFTIQSNLIAVAVFLIGATRAGQPGSPTWDHVRGAAVLYMTITLIVFAVLLSGVDVDTAMAWVDTVVHRVFPIVVIADWIIDPPASRLPFRAALTWVAYPLAWTGYTIVRGALSGWYPYPFLDPENGGYTTVAAYVVGILVLGVVLIAILVAVGNAARDRFGPNRTAATA